VEYLSLFTLAAGVVVVLAAVRATQDERHREAALLRALGASQATVMSGLLAEFLTLGLIAGTVAAIGASATGYVLARFAFEIEYYFNLALCVWGPLAGAAIVGAAGLFGTRTVAQTPPMAALRRG
jgi:putative ABC transport system permease protein